MSNAPNGARAPGSFSPMIASSATSRPLLRRVESSDSESTSSKNSQSVVTLSKRPQFSTTSSSNSVTGPPRPLYASSIANSSSSSLQSQNFSRPNPAPLRTDLARSELRNVSPMTSARSSSDYLRGHARKHSQTQGSFEPYLATAATSNLSSMAHGNGSSTTVASQLSASQIAAQAAMQHQTLHMRQRSQTVPTQNMAEGNGPSGMGSRKASAARGPISPPLLSLTEASAPKDSTYFRDGQIYYNGLLGGPHTNAAHTAANVVFPKSPSSSPGLPSYEHPFHHPDKPMKTEKSKTKLFSRPGKIGISRDKSAGPTTNSNTLPSPSKNKASFNSSTYSLVNSLSRGNKSTNSLADTLSSAASMYSMANSSTATIRGPEQQDKEQVKDKKHHFLSRQKHKLSSKDDYNLPLSSAASNSKPVDPSAPSSLYQFNLPPSPGPTTTSFSKSVSGLDLRHGGKALRERRKEEKNEAAKEAQASELSLHNSNEWPGPSSLGSVSTSGFGLASSHTRDGDDSGRFGLNNMTADDAWPYLKAKLLIIFEGEDLRLPVEDFNRLVTTHIQRTLPSRSPSLILSDLRDLLITGFSSLSHTLSHTPSTLLIPDLVSIWLFTFTSILPYMQAVFLPLDLEFSGNGPLMTPDQARDFWGVLPSNTKGAESETLEAGQVLEVRRIVLTAFRDVVILPRFEMLKQIFSRLSLDSITLPVPSSDTLSSSPDSYSTGDGRRPGTAMSSALDPSMASYGSQTTTLLGDSSGSRSRAISNVSYTSDPSSLPSGLGITNLPHPPRPFTPSSAFPLRPSQPAASRSQTVEDSGKKLTETVGRMLQCMSVLASVGVGAGLGGLEEEEKQKRIEELGRGLKLNWLGRGRMGRDRRGLVGARVNRGGTGDSLGVGA